MKAPVLFPNALKPAALNLTRARILRGIRYHELSNEGVSTKKIQHECLLIHKQNKVQHQHTFQLALDARTHPIPHYPGGSTAVPGHFPACGGAAECISFQKNGSVILCCSKTSWVRKLQTEKHFIGKGISVAKVQNCLQVRQANLKFKI